MLTKWLSIIIPLALGTALIIYTYNQFEPQQIDEIKGYFNKANYFYIFISLVISTVGCASRAYRWKYSLSHMGYHSSFGNNFMAVSVGYMMNMTIPRSGEFSRALVLKKYNDIPFDKAFGTIVAERIVDSLILLLLIIVTFFVQFDVVKAFVIDQIPIEQTVWLVGIGLVLTTIAALLYFYSTLTIVLKIKEKVSGLKEGVLSIVRMKDKWPFIFHTILIWVTYILMFYVTVFILDETSDISFGAVLSSFIVGSIAIAVTSSGFGTYPFLIAQILMFYSIPFTIGTAFGYIVWISQVLLVMATGAISFLLLPVLNKSK
jgi:uncharacterized protein (TIRG00374 family)